MSNPEHVRALTDINSFTEFLKDPVRVTLDLVGETFKDRNWSGWNLSGADFRNCSFENVKFDTSTLHGANFEHAKISSCTFLAAQLPQARFISASLNNVSFERALLTSAYFGNASCPPIQGQRGPLKFAQASLESATLSEARFQNADFSGSNLRGAEFMRADVSYANFSGARLENAHMRWANLDFADLRSANLHGAELFETSTVKTKIRRYDLEDIRADGFCKMKPSEIQKMDVEDGYGDLRNYFSGFWTVIHLGSIAIWLFPILILVARSLVFSHSPTLLLPGGSVQLSLWEQIEGLWKSGLLWPMRSQLPPYWEYPLNFWYCASWTAILVYNIARFALIARVKLLEHRQLVTGMHPLFTISGGTKVLFVLTKWLFVVNLGLVTYHLIHFLVLTSYPVPIK